jgi:hypothetical protein
MDDTSLLAFKTIFCFVKELSDVFGTRQHSLLLYHRLMEKTNFMHTKAVQKHLDIFRGFCVNNSEAIQSKNANFIKFGVIKYSDRVFIDMNRLFELADKDTVLVMWKHILAISAYLDPGSNAKKILKETMEDKRKQGEQGVEEEFLSGLIEKVESSIDSEEINDPLQVVNKIMSSGVFNDLMTNMQDGLSSGKLDLNKLMGTVQGMMGKMGGNGDNTGGGIDMGAMMSMMSGMVSQQQ